jgi:hypothetical protein
MFKVEAKGFDALKRRLDQLAENVRSLSGERTVAMKDILTDDFMQAHTKFSSFEEMLTRSGFAVETQDDFKAIPDAEWDAYIHSNSIFATWTEILTAGAREVLRRKLLRYGG